MVELRGKPKLVKLQTAYDELEQWEKMEREARERIFILNLLLPIFLEPEVKKCPD